MKPKWLIQTNTEDTDIEPIITEITSQGMTVLPIEFDPISSIDLSMYNPDDCIIGYGDIDFVLKIQKQTPFIPGVYCNFHNMRCSTYYTYLGEHLLNKQYIMIPVGELLRRWDNITVIPGSLSPVRMSLFIRPDSGAKPFTGYIVQPGDKHKIQTLVQAVGPETLVIVCPEKSITAEWRFVICDKKVVTGCQYLPTESQTFSPSSLRLAQKIASQEWQPDLCYTVDIAESGGNMHLLEINSFSCAGLYACNLASIVREVSSVAVKEWEEYRDPNF